MIPRRSATSFAASFLSTLTIVAVLGTILGTMSVLTSCQSANQSPNLSEPTEPPAESTETDDAGAADAATESADVEPEETEPTVDVSEIVLEGRSLDDNLAAIAALKSEADLAMRQPPDQQGAVEELVAKVSAARRALAEMYSGDDVSAADHYKLCLNFHRFGSGHARDAATHCDAYLQSEGVDRNSTDYGTALATGGDSHLSAGDFDKAEKAYRGFIEGFCTEELQKQWKSLKPHCLQILTQRLPAIYHRTGNVGRLREVIDECWAHGIDREYDLVTIRRHLLTDLWKETSTEPLERLARDLLGRQVWGEKSPRTNRGLVPAALSAMARVQLIKRGCLGARAVYIDYEFEHPEVDKVWARTHLVPPRGLLCQPAPAVVAETWIDGKAPQATPGSGGKAILLHFLDASRPASLRLLEEVEGLAERNRGSLQIIGLVPMSDRVYDLGARKRLANLDKEGFVRAVARVTKEAGNTHPLGILTGPQDPLLQAYGIQLAQSIPALVLVDRDGKVVAYQAKATIDGGWDLAVKALK